MGMGGVQRVYNIPKNLKEFGWDVDVYTPYPPYSYPRDIDSFRIDNLNVTRVFCPDPLHVLPKVISSPGAGKRDYFSFPDNKILCLPFLWRKLKSTDVAVISCPPFSLLLTSAIIKNTPYVLDYRDLWTGSYLGKYFFNWEELLAKKIEKRCIDKASAVVTVTQEIGENLSAKYSENKNKIYLIRNGFDDEIFPKNKRNEKTEKITLTYMGSFNNLVEPDLIFAGLKNLFQQKPELRKRLVFKYIGPSMIKNLKSMAKDIGLKNFIPTGYLPHERAISELTTSDLLILLGGGADEDKWLIPGKLYQYLRTGLPVIAATKNKEIREIIGSAGIICDPEPEAVANAILNVIKNPQSFEKDSNISNYSWLNLSRKYSNLLKSVL